MRRTVIILIALVLALGALPGHAGPRLRVKADHVNLRARPDMNSKTVAQVQRGDILVSIGDTADGWIAVTPPDSADLWIYGELVRDGVVGVSRLKVRAGPGINYRDVGVLARGQSVKVRGRHVDWLKIAPSPGSVLWVSGEFVTPVVIPVAAAKPPPAPQPRPRPKPKPVPRPQPVGPETGPALSPAPIVKAPPLVETPPDAKDTTWPLPASIAGRALVESRRQGRSVEYIGVMRPAAPTPGRPSRHRVVRYDAQGRARTICYVIGNDAQLDSIVGRTMMVKGREYWIQGVRYPALAVVQMVRRD